VSEPKAQVVRRWFEGFARGEVTPEICEQEIEIRNWSESPVPGPYHGHQGLHDWWQDLADAFDEIHFELTDVFDVDDEHVLTIQRLVGRFRLTGVDVDVPWGSVVRVREGKIRSAVGYASPEQAKQAVGMQD
jgi:ketosteroid isomerase-like protein